MVVGSSRIVVSNRIRELAILIKRHVALSRHIVAHGLIFDGYSLFMLVRYSIFAL